MQTYIVLWDGGLRLPIFAKSLTDLGNKLQSKYSMSTLLNGNIAVFTKREFERALARKSALGVR